MCENGKLILVDNCSGYGIYNYMNYNILFCVGTSVTVDGFKKVSDVDKINCFRSRYFEWYLRPAGELLRGADNAYAAFLIDLCVIDSLSCFFVGDENADVGKRYCLFLKRYLDCSDNITPMSVGDICSGLYKHSRCGLVHNTMTKDNWIISGCPHAFEPGTDVATGNSLVVVNPHKLHDLVIKCLDKFLDDVRLSNVYTPSELSEKYKNGNPLINNAKYKNIREGFFGLVNTQFV